MKKEDTRRKNEEALRKKLHNFIDKADSKGLQAMDGFVDNVVNAREWWKNKEFMDEIKQAWKDYTNGGQVYTHEQMMEMAKKAIKSVKNRPA